MHEYTDDIKTITQRGYSEFGRRLPLLSLWQELALNFYPQRANFTTDLTMGEDFASHLTTSYPVIVMRTLQNAVPAMLRPKDLPWFKITVDDDAVNNNLEAKAWLQRASEMQRAFMYRKDSGFVRCMSEVDADFMCFGNAAKYVSENNDFTGMMYKSVHLKDIVWFEDSAGHICEVHRRLELNASDAIHFFGKENVHEQVRQSFKDGKNQTKFKFHHIVIEAEKYHGVDKDIVKRGFKYISLWVDVTNKHVMEKEGSHNLRYVISRWQTVSGFQYGYSLAAQIALPDARLLQAMSLTALEAAQKAVDPPLLATDDVVRSDVNTFSGGITYVDKDYDERLGDAMRPMTVDKSGLQFGMQMIEMVKASIADALYENKISLPPAGPDMTATEIMQRVKEYARTALPLFSPIEEEESAQTCEMTFEILMRNGAFGPLEEIPEVLMDQDIKFRFTSPLSESRGETVKQQFMEVINLSATVGQIDQSASGRVDLATAFNDVLNKIDTPADWMLSDEEFEQLQAQKQQMQQIQETSMMAQEAGAGAQALMGVGS